MVSNREKKEHQKKLLIAGVTIFLMVSSLLAIISSSLGNTSKDKYNGISFVAKEDKYYGQVWTAEIGDNIYQFNVHPSQVSNIILPNVTNIKNSPRISITNLPPSITDTDANYIAAAEYGLVDSLQTMGKYVVNGFTNNTGYKIPKISCENASLENPVIMFQRNNVTSIELENNCLTLNAASQTDFFLVKDAILYELLGVNNNE